MATFLVTVPAVSGELYPLLSVAQGLAKRGHRVLVHTEQRADAKVKAAGAELVAMPNAYFNLVERVKGSKVSFPWWVPGFIRIIGRFRHEVLTLASDMVSELEPIIKREKIDCLIADNLTVGAAYAAEKYNIPFVTVSTSWVVTLKENGLPVDLPPLPLPSSIINNLIDTILPLDRVRQQLNLPLRATNKSSEFFSVIVSQLLNLVVIDKEFIPSEELRENQIFIGPTTFQIPSSSDKPPFGKHLEPGTILVSSTTSSNMDNGLLRRILEALVPMEIPILATSGCATDIPSKLPSNIRLETFVPFEEVLPYVKAIVTHGGFGTVGRAFKNGVPMLIISSFGDTESTGQRAEELGLAYHLPINKATPEAITAKFKELLEDSELHARVKALSEKLRSMNSPELAAKAIESVLQKQTIAVAEYVNK